MMIDRSMISKDKSANPLTLNKNGLQYQGQSIDMLSGSVHYWRLEPRLWDEILARCRDLGLTFVCTYVPWSVHERSPNRWDFEGPRNLQLFCETAAKNELPVLLRPGPHINSEITGFGYPEWILARPELFARGPTGAPVTIPAPARGFHVPSYASSLFWGEVARFFDALAPRFAQLFAPGGPAVGLQADNENSFFFRTAPFDQDYHPDAINQYRSWLEEKYQSPEALANAHGQNPTAFSKVEPPRRYENGDKKTLQRFCDWVSYKEKLARDGVLKTAQLLRERLPEGSSPLFFHNYPPSNLLASPFDVAGVEQAGVDVQGVDFYPTIDQHEYLYKQCRTLHGCSRFPFIPEMGTGSSPWNGVVRLEDQVFTIPYCFMHGIQGMNFYMFVERERWYGSPIAETGRVRPDHKDFFQPFLKTMKDIGISSLETPGQVVILASKQYQRMAHATYLLSPVPPLLLSLMGHDASLSCSEHKFGYDRNQPIEFEETLNTWIELCATHNVPVRLVEDNVDIPRAQRDLVLIPAFHDMDPALVEKLKVWAAEGSKLVFTPQKPELFSTDEGSLEETPVQKVLEDYVPTWAPTLDGVESVLKVAKDGQSYLFFANVLKEVRTLTLGSQLQAAGLTLLWGEGICNLDGELTLPAKTVTIFRLEQEITPS
jgi:beta-galactosidase